MGSTARGAARSFRNRVRYRFDRLLSRGTWAVLLWLGILTFLVVVFSAALLTISGVTFSGSESTSVLEDFWQSLLRVIDPGTMAADVGWGRRILALIVTLTGLLIAGTLIGLIAAGVERRVEQLRQGRSIVVESNHYVVLGWSERLRVVIDQLTTEDPKATVVVLADRNAADVDHDLRLGLDPAVGHRLVIRSGDPRLPSGLELTNIDEARAIVVLADEDRGGGADVVTTVLTVGRRVGFDGVPIVVEVPDESMREKLLRATGPSVRPVIVAESASRVAALVLRQSGLSEVVEALLDPRHPGIHITGVPQRLIACSFGDAVVSLDAARPIGVIGADGELRLNPPAARTLDADDQLVTIAADAGDVVVGKRRISPPPAEPLQLAIVSSAMRLLFIGWNSIAPALLVEFDRLAAAGSTALVWFDDTVLTTDDIVIPHTRNLELDVLPGSDPTLPLRDGGITAAVVLAYESLPSVNDADGRTLLDLTLLQRELAASERSVPQLLVQLLDDDRSTLAHMTGLDGFLISEGIGSAMIAQLAVVPQRQDVFRRLYDPDRASIHLVSLERLGIDAPATFDEVVSAACASGVLAIGWLTSRERGQRADPQCAVDGTSRAIRPDRRRRLTTTRSPPRRTRSCSRWAPTIEPGLIPRRERGVGSTSSTSRPAISSTRLAWFALAPATRHIATS